MGLKTELLLSHSPNKINQKPTNTSNSEGVKHREEGYGGDDDDDEGEE